MGTIDWLHEPSRLRLVTPYGTATLLRLDPSPADHELPNTSPVDQPVYEALFKHASESDPLPLGTFDTFETAANRVYALLKSLDVPVHPTSERTFYARILKRLIAADPHTSFAYIPFLTHLTATLQGQESPSLAENAIQLKWQHERAISTTQFGPYQCHIRMHLPSMQRRIGARPRYEAVITHEPSLIFPGEFWFAEYEDAESWVDAKLAEIMQPSFGDMKARELEWLVDTWTSSVTPHLEPIDQLRLRWLKQDVVSLIRPLAMKAAGIDAKAFEFLQRATPDDWHQVASHWNWDAGFKLIEWIVEQPQCDRGTALMIYWICTGQGYEPRPAGDGVDRMLHRIQTRMLGHGYTRQKIRFNPDQIEGVDPRFNLDLDIPTMMYEPSPGVPLLKRFRYHDLLP